MNIDKLEPGPDLDALIEKVIYKRIPCDKWREWESRDSSGQPIYQKEDCGHPVDSCYPIQSLNPYSTNIINACAIVDELREQGLVINIRNLAFTICLAALKAVEPAESP